VITRLVAVTALIVGLALGSPSAEAAPDGCAKGFVSVTGSTCNKSLEWSYDPTLKAFVRRAQTIGSLDAEGRARYRYVVGVRCEGGALCGASAFTCPVLDARRGLRYRAMAYLLRPDGTDAPDTPPLDSSVCEYPGAVVPLAVVEQGAREELTKRISQPVVSSAPPGKTLVNLPTIFATTPQPEQSLTFTTPVPGRLVAVPEYTWDFGDGLTGMGPGLAYQPGDIPSKLPGKYLTATYRTAGAKSVVVTVTWRVRFVLEDVLDVPLAPIVFTAGETKEVAIAKAVLVR